MSNVDPRVRDGADILTNNEPPKQASGDPQRHVSEELGPEHVVIGASYALHLLQGSRHYKNLCDGQIGAKPEIEFNQAGKLSAIARGMCRRPGEVIAMCLEPQSNNLTAVSENRLHGNDARPGSQNAQGDQVTLRSMEGNVQKCVCHVDPCTTIKKTAVANEIGSLLQEMKQQDARPDLLRLLRKSEPSAALKLAIRQTTQQMNGNQQIPLPLKDHMEILEWFDHKNQWKDIKNGPFLAVVEALGYRLASSFEKR